MNLRNLDELYSSGIHVAKSLNAGLRAVSAWENLPPGREGRRIGTLFTLGDDNAVLARSRPLILIRCRGMLRFHSTSPNLNLRGTIEELAQLDGGYISRWFDSVCAPPRLNFT
jgi:hypothetical protein